MRNRQTVEWAKRLTARLCLVRPGCGCGSFFGGQRNDCVDLRSDTIDLLKVLLTRCSARASRAESFLARMSAAISTAEVKQSEAATGSAFSAAGSAEESEAAVRPTRTSRRVGWSCCGGMAASVSRVNAPLRCRALYPCAKKSRRNYRNQTVVLKGTVSAAEVTASTQSPF